MHCKPVVFSYQGPRLLCLYLRLGTIDYLSPEILDCPPKYHPQDHKSNPQIWYTNKVDCWSVGVLAYELLAGKTPFEDVSGSKPGLLHITNRDLTIHKHHMKQSICHTFPTTQIYAVCNLCCHFTHLFRPLDCHLPAVTLCHLLLPCLQKTPQETLYRIKSEEVSYPLGLSEGAVAFMRQALVRDPAQRSDMQELLNHPWILSHKRHAVLPSMRSRTQTQVPNRANDTLVAVCNQHD